MTDPLSVARFRALAEAYGAIERWPAGLREEGSRMAGRPDLAAIVAEAASLDARLDSWTSPAPSTALRGAILGQRQRTLRRRLRLWWSALGVATALAGAATGSLAIAAMPVDHHHPFGDDTAFGNVSMREE